MLDLIDLVQMSNDNTDLQLELLGTLVYIHSDKWEEIISQTNFIEFLHNNLMSGYAEDDIMLESIMLVSTICRNEACSEKIAASYLISMLHNLLGAKQEDDEMVQ